MRSLLPEPSDDFLDETENPDDRESSLNDVAGNLQAMRNQMEPWDIYDGVGHADENHPVYQKYLRLYEEALAVLPVEKSTLKE